MTLRPRRIAQGRRATADRSPARPFGAIAGLACAASIIAACASPTYNFTTEELVIDPARLANVSRFALYDEDAVGRVGGDEGVDQAIGGALVRELAQRGWTEAASRDAADAVVAYAITSAEGSRLVSDISLGRYATFDEDAARELAYVDHALVVDVFSWPDGENLWRGRAIARLYSPVGEARDDVIDQAVAQVVGQLDDDLGRTGGEEP